MKKKISFAIIITAVLLLFSIIISMNSSKQTVGSGNIVGESANIKSTSDKLRLPDEMRGLWVSFITLDMSDTDRSFEAFKGKFEKIVSDAKELKCNTLIVQIRPFCDALYYSDIFPSSHILSGTQGVKPEYDALEYMCEYAHKNDLYIHAWINPYRVATSGLLNELSKSNPFIENTELGFETESGIFLDPSKKEVRKLITDGVAEIIENYDVDGIQFDDYFYPSDCGDFDADEYNTYRKSQADIAKSMTLSQWRINNVNLLIANVYKEIKQLNKSVAFGIAPQGNIDNDYSLYADVKSWCEVYGYVDYICPQMYYSIDNPALSFAKSISDWKEYEAHSNLKMYVGLGAYKAGSDADSGTWLNHSDELKNQLQMLREQGYDGYILYDYNAIISDNAKNEIEAFRSVVD